MRVVICAPYPFDESDSSSGDGLMQSVVTLSHALAKQPRLDVHVLTRSTRASSETSSVVNGVSVTWVPDPFPPLDYLVDRSLLRRKFANVLARLKPDIIHAHGEPPFIRAALDAPIPHVITLQGIFADQTRAHSNRAPLSYRCAYALLRRWEAGYLPRIRNLIAINSTIAEQVRGRSPGVRVFAIKNPVEDEFFEVPDLESRPTILFVGQISRRKGVHLLLEAFERLAPAHPECQLRIVGDRLQDPAYASDLEQQHAPLIASGRIKFLGPGNRFKVRDELSHCSLLCLPSYYEASPVVVIEAMAAGKPVVATEAGDVRELVADTESGIVVGSGDVSGLASAIDSLLRDQSARKAAGARAREAARHRAAPSSIAQQTLSVYETVMAEKTGRALP